MEESLQEISNVILAEHKTMKQSLKLQEEYNQKLILLMQEMNDRVSKLEDRR
jgi:hypothetical protein